MTALQAEKRKEFKRSVLNSIRQSGHIPAVLYGKSVPNTPIMVEKNDFLKEIKESGRNGVLSIMLNGKTEKAVVRSYQEHPLTKEIVHIDFLAVDAQTEIDAEVRVVLTGEAYGVKDGGVLQQPLYQVSVTGKPEQIPEAIEVDVTELKVGETILISDILGNYSIKMNHQDDEVIASILPPKQEEEISTGEEQEPGIPDNLEGRETQESEE